MNMDREHQTQPPLDQVVSDAQLFANRPEVSASSRLNTQVQRLLELTSGKKQDSITQASIDELGQMRKQLEVFISGGTLNGKEQLYTDLIALINRAINEMRTLLSKHLREMEADKEKQEKEQKNKLPAVFERTLQLNVLLEQTLNSESATIDQVSAGAANSVELTEMIADSFAQTPTIDAQIGALLAEIDEYLSVFEKATFEASEAEDRAEKLRKFSEIRGELVKHRERSVKLWRDNYHLVVPSLRTLRGFFETAQNRVDDEDEDPTVVITELNQAVEAAHNDPHIAEHTGQFRDALQEDYFHRATELRKALLQSWNEWLMNPNNPNQMYAVAAAFFNDYRTRFIDGNEEFTVAAADEINNVVAMLETGRDGFPELEQQDFINNTLIIPLREFPTVVARKKEGNLEKKRKELENYPLGLKNIINYLEGMYPLHGHPEWKDGGWKKAKASEMARAIFAATMQHIDHVGFSGHNLYIGKLELINIEIQDLEDHPRMGTGILNGFKALATYFQELADSGLEEVDVELAQQNARLIPGLAGQLANDFVEIDRTLNFGQNVKNSLNDIDRIIGTVFAGGEAKEQSAYDHKNITRLFELGKGYLEEEDNAELVALYKRMGRALQNIFAVNEPILHEEAIYSAPDAHGHTIFLRNLNETNPLGWFPEENVGAGQSDLRIVKRLLVQITAGRAEKPVWQTGDDYEVRMQLARDHFRNHLFGDPAAGYSESRPDPESLWGRYLADENPQKLSELSFLNRDEKKARDEGKLPEMLASNMYMAGLEGGKASGSKVKRDKLTGELITENIGGTEYPIVGASAGVLGENQLDRLLNSVYRRKTKTGTGGEGSSGPVISVDWVYSTVQTLFDRYSRVEKNEMVGHTLKEKMMLCDDETWGDVKWSDYIEGGAEEKTAWPKGVDTGARYYKTLIKRLGIRWNAILSAQHGSEATTPTYDYNALEMLTGWSREVYYMLTRDYGAIIHKWETESVDGRGEAKDDYVRFKEIEKIFDQQDNNVFPENPNVIDPPITQDEWNLVIKLNKVPTTKHVNYDARPVKDDEGNQAGKGMARYTTNIHHSYRLAPYLPAEAHLNEFEQEVYFSTNELAPPEDAYLQFKKTILGYLIMNDISVNSVGMSWDDAAAIVEFLSHERWSRRHDNEVMKKISQITGHPHGEYNGLGLYTEKEAFALLTAAKVDTGILSRAQAYMERAHKLPFIGGGGGHH